jgi:hypothetical protein
LARDFSATAAIVTKGGELPFAALCTDVCYAQKVNFAKLSERHIVDLNPNRNKYPLKAKFLLLLVAEEVG